MQQILIIDDDPSGAQLLATQLGFEGHTAFQLEDWEDPLSDVERHRPSLVIMDVHLRHRSGFDLLRQLRAHPEPDLARTPVLMMSAEDYRIQSKQAGADGFLAKPFDIQAFADIVKRMTIANLH